MSATAAPSAIVNPGLMHLRSLEATDAMRQALARQVTKDLQRLNLTQAELSRQSGISREAINTYCRGTSYPSPVNMQKLARTLGYVDAGALEDTVRSAPQKQAQQQPEADTHIFPTPDRPGHMTLRLHKSLPMEVAFEILSIIERARRDG